MEEDPVTSECTARSYDFIIAVGGGLFRGERDTDFGAAGLEASYSGLTGNAGLRVKDRYSICDENAAWGDHKLVGCIWNDSNADRIKDGFELWDKAIDGPYNPSRPVGNFDAYPYTASPGAGQVGPNLSKDLIAQWRGYFEFDAGTYRFYLDSDDGSRLFINDVERINYWSDHIFGAAGAPKTYNVTFATADSPGGGHNLRLEYYQATSGQELHFWWEKISSPAPPVSGTIQGIKVKMPGNQMGQTPPSTETVTLDGGSPQTTETYTYSNVSAGNHTVAVTVPSGWSVGYTLCYNSTACHTSVPTSGSSVVVDVPAGGYADLWWHYTPPPETLSVALEANPSSGPDPLGSVLSADITGTDVGTINYSFWWNCTSTSNSVSTVENACGALPVPALGSCAGSSAGYKCLAVANDPQNAPSSGSHSYTPSGTYTAKVIAERGTAPPAEARTTVTVTVSPLAPNISLNSLSCSSANTPQVVLNYSANLPPPATRIELYRSGTPTAIFTDNAPSNTNRTYTDTNATGGETYVYSAIAFNGATASPTSSTAPVSAPVCVPAPSVTTQIIRVNGSTTFNLRNIKDGDLLQFRVTFTNGGPGIATRIDNTTTLSSNLTYRGASFRCTSATISCVPGTFAGDGTNPLVFYANGSLAAGSSLIAEFEATVNTLTTQTRELLIVRNQGFYSPGPTPYDLTYALLAAPAGVIRPDFIEVP